MTEYTDHEYSAHEGSPLEAYKFVGTRTSYHYTSADQDITIAGQLYTAIPISRSPISVNSQEETPELEIQVPYDLDLVQDYVYGVAPASLTLEILRYHEGTDPGVDYVTIWKGIVTLFTIDGHLAKLKIPSIFSLLFQTEIPAVWYHQPCNHVLYDDRCNLTKATYKTTSTITIVNGYTVTVVNDGAINGWLQVGEIVNTTRNERRLIVNNVDNVIYMNFPFKDAVAGDAVELYPGCTHAFSVCRDKFNNSQHFGGFPYIPTDNPFGRRL